MTMPTKFPATRHRTSLLAGTLLVSAVLNLFLVGVLAGVVPGAKHKSFAPLALGAPHGEFLVDGMTRYLTPADAQAFHDVVQAQTDALREAHDHVRQATKDVAAAFEQDPPDAAALQSATGHVDEAKAEVNAVVEKIVANAYTKISPDGRHRLAELTH